MSNQNELTLNEKATNAETWDHINMVMKVLAAMQLELMKRQFTHDRSKLEPPEVSIFTEFTGKLRTTTFGSDEYKQHLKDMKPALDHHYSHNRHHPEMYQLGVNDMNLIDVLEMICDWWCACKRHADGDILKSIEINKDRFGLSDQLVSILINTVPILKDPFEDLHTQKDI